MTGTATCCLAVIAILLASIELSRGQYAVPPGGTTCNYGACLNTFDGRTKDDIEKPNSTLENTFCIYIKFIQCLTTECGSISVPQNYTMFIDNIIQNNTFSCDSNGATNNQFSSSSLLLPVTWFVVAVWLGFVF